VKLELGEAEAETRRQRRENFFGIKPDKRHKVGLREASREAITLKPVEMQRAHGQEVSRQP